MPAAPYRDAYGSWQVPSLQVPSSQQISPRSQASPRGTHAGRSPQVPSTQVPTQQVSPAVQASPRGTQTEPEVWQVPESQKPSQHCESLLQPLPSRTQEQRRRPFWSVMTFFVQHFLHGRRRFPRPHRLPAGMQFSLLTSSAPADECPTAARALPAAAANAPRTTSRRDAPAARRRAMRSKVA